MTPGSEILLTRNSTAAFEELNPGRALGYRKIHSSDMGEGIKAFVADFSIADGLQNVPAVHNLLTSKEPAQRKAAWKMIKNATIISDLAGPDYPGYTTRKKKNIVHDHLFFTACAVCSCVCADCDAGDGSYACMDTAYCSRLKSEFWIIANNEFWNAYRYASSLAIHQRNFLQQ
jgi:hypothetical protein